MPQTLERTRHRAIAVAQPHSAPVRRRFPPSIRPLLAIALACVFVVASWAAAQKTALSIDLRGDIRAQAQALLENSAFVAADSGDRICDRPCRLRLSLAEAGALDHHFELAAISEGSGHVTSLLLRTAPNSLSAAYDEATELLVSLAFADEEIALLEDWFRRAKHDAGAARSFLAHRQLNECSLRLGVLRADEARHWKIALEVEFD